MHQFTPITHFHGSPDALLNRPKSFERGSWASWGGRVASVKTYLPCVVTAPTGLTPRFLYLWSACRSLSQLR